MFLPASGLMLTWCSMRRKSRGQGEAVVMGTLRNGAFPEMQCGMGVSKDDHWGRNVTMDHASDLEWRLKIMET